MKVDIFRNVYGSTDLYYPLHDGVTGDPATITSIPDHSSLLPLALNTPDDATQWDAVNGDFVLPPGNTQYAMHNICDSGSLPQFQQFEYADSVCVLAFRFRVLGVASSSGRVLSLWKNSSQVFDVRYAESGVLQLNFNNRGSGGVDANALTSDSGIFIAIMDLRQDNSETVATYLYDPGRYKIIGGSTNKNSFDGSMIPDYTAEVGDTFTIGARNGTGGFTNFADNISVSDVRWLNFGPSQPNDLMEMIEEWSARRLQGSTRHA